MDPISNVNSNRYVANLLNEAARESSEAGRARQVRFGARDDSLTISFVNDSGEKVKLDLPPIPAPAGGFGAVDSALLRAKLDEVAKVFEKGDGAVAINRELKGMFANFLRLTDGDNPTVPVPDLGDKGPDLGDKGSNLGGKPPKYVPLSSNDTMVTLFMLLALLSECASIQRKAGFEARNCDYQQTLSSIEGQANTIRENAHFAAMTALVSIGVQIGVQAVTTGVGKAMQSKGADAELSYGTDVNKSIRDNTMNLGDPEAASSTVQKLADKLPSGEVGADRMRAMITGRDRGGAALTTDKVNEFTQKNPPVEPQPNGEGNMIELQEIKPEVNPEVKPENQPEVKPENQNQPGEVPKENQVENQPVEKKDEIKVGNENNPEPENVENKGEPENVENNNNEGQNPQVEGENKQVEGENNNINNENKEPVENKEGEKVGGEQQNVENKEPVEQEEPPILNNEDRIKVTAEKAHKLDDAAQKLEEAKQGGKPEEIKAAQENYDKAKEAYRSQVDENVEMMRGEFEAKGAEYRGLLKDDRFGWHGFRATGRSNLGRSYDGMRMAGKNYEFADALRTEAFSRSGPGGSPLLDKQEIGRSIGTARNGYENSLNVAHADKLFSANTTRGAELLQSRQFISTIFQSTDAGLQSMARGRDADSKLMEQETERSKMTTETDNEWLQAARQLSDKVNAVYAETIRSQLDSNARIMA